MPRGATPKRSKRCWPARPRVLVVTHEIPIRYALNGLGGSPTLDGPAHEIPNSVPYLFDEEGLQRAVAGIETVVGKVSA